MKFYLKKAAGIPSPPSGNINLHYCDFVLFETSYTQVVQVDLQKWIVYLLFFVCSSGIELSRKFVDFYTYLCVVANAKISEYWASGIGTDGLLDYKSWNGLTDAPSD